MRQSPMSRNCNEKRFRQTTCLAQHATNRVGVGGWPHQKPPPPPAGGVTSIWPYCHIFRWNLSNIAWITKKIFRICVSCDKTHNEHPLLAPLWDTSSFFLQRHPGVRPSPSCGCYPFLPVERFSTPAAGPPHPPTRFDFTSKCGCPPVDFSTYDEHVMAGVSWSPRSCCLQHSFRM